MNNDDYRVLYIKINNIRNSFNDLLEYNSFILSELKENFKLDKEIIENNKLTNYCNNIKEIETEISNTIIPDIYNKI